MFPSRIKIMMIETNIFMSSKILVSWFKDEEPANMGYPMYNSAAMHPTDHISIYKVRGSPRIISGAL